MMVGGSQERMTIRGTSSKGNQEDDRCQDKLDKTEAEGEMIMAQEQ